MKKQTIRLNEKQLHRIIKESVKRVLREEFEEEKPSYVEWEKFLNGNSPIFEFEDGLVYVDYDENKGCLCSGGVTNAGFYQDGEVCVPVEDGNFQRALEEVYEELMQNHTPIE